MRALYYRDWNQLDIRDVDPPTPGEGEVLIRVSACGICGSEIEAVVHRAPRRTPPRILGHEFCGIVEDTGARVVVNAVLSCGECAMCRAGLSNLCGDRQVFGMHRQGAFTEFVCAPTEHLFDWPDDVPAEVACLAEPLANGVHIAKLMASIQPRSVAIIGAGSIGLMCLQAIRDRFQGIFSLVIDLDPTRLEVAKGLGADLASGVDIDRIAGLLRDRGMTFGGHPGVDVVVDAAGVGPSKRMSLELTRPGGQAIWIGLGEDKIELSTFGITLGERSVLGSYAATSEDIQDALDLMAARRVDVSSWTTNYDPDHWLEGFNAQLDPATRDVKAILTMTR